MMVFFMSDKRFILVKVFTTNLRQGRDLGKGWENVSVGQVFEVLGRV
jgi:hypothetical protein